MSEIKPPKSYGEQIEKLRSRGCQINNIDVATDILANINYYRFSAYFLPFRKQDGTYWDGTNIVSIHNIYEFDRKIRNILFVAIGKTEILMRSRLAYFHAQKYGASGYLESVNYNKKHQHQRFLDKINSVIETHKGELFVKHHCEKYRGRFPIWAIIELFSFGMLSYFYADLTTQDQKTVANALFSLNYRVLLSYMRCCTDLRNICAHYGRLYFRQFSALPAELTILKQNEKSRLFGQIMVLKNLYVHPHEWNQEIAEPISQLIEQYKNDINLYHIGFPTNWKERLFFCPN